MRTLDLKVGATGGRVAAVQLQHLKTILKRSLETQHQRPCLAYLVVLTAALSGVANRFKVKVTKFNQMVACALDIHNGI